MRLLARLTTASEYRLPTGAFAILLLDSFSIPLPFEMGPSLNAMPNIDSNDRSVARAGACSDVAGHWPAPSERRTYRSKPSRMAAMARSSALRRLSP